MPIVKTFDLDKLASPITRTTGALKQFKDKAVQKALPSVYTKMKDVERANAKLRRAEPVVDEQTYKNKAPLLDDLISACTAAHAELTNLMGKPVHTPATVRKSGNSIEVTLLPDRVSKPTVKDVPKLGPKLTDLQEKVSSLKKQAEAERDYLQKWYRENIQRTGDIVITFSGADTDMIANVDKKGAITMPPHQRFTAHIIYDKLPGILINELKARQNSIATAFKRKLTEFQKQTASRFAKWQSEFANIKLEHDADRAKVLFKNINHFFDDELPKEIEKELSKAAELPKAQMVMLKISGGTMKVETDFSGFAVFEVKLPDRKPSDDLTEGLNDALTGLEKTEKAYDLAAETIKESYGRIAKTAEEMARLLKDLERRLRRAKGEDQKQSLIDDDERQRNDYENDMQDASNDLERAIAEADRSRSNLLTELGKANKSFDQSVREMKGKSNVSKRALQDVRLAVNDTLKFLNRQLAANFKTLESAASEADGVRKAFTAAVESGMKPDTVESRLPAAIKQVESADFSLKSAKLNSMIDVSECFSKVRSSAEKLGR